jgi:hypothetical protein
LGWIYPPANIADDFGGHRTNSAWWCRIDRAARALIGMAAVMPGIVGRSLVELWLWEQQKKQRPINAIAIKRWAGIGLWFYLWKLFQPRQQSKSWRWLSLPPVSSLLR